MPVALPDELQQFVTHVVATGAYQSETDVICSALRLLQQRQQRIEELRRELRPALDRLDRGEGIELDDDSLDEFFADIERRGDERLHSERKQS